MKKNLTEMVFILDRSGSMSGLEKDTIGGFNGLLGKQKKEEGEANVTTVLFDDRVQLVHDRTPIQQVKNMDEDTYYVRGCTALYDAVGFSIQRMIQTQKVLPEEEKADKVVFMITTDGYENASHEYSVSQVKKMIEAQKEKNWEFIFLGANIDAQKEAARFGIDASRAATYTNDEEGVALNFVATSEIIGKMRKTKKYDRTMFCTEALAQVRDYHKKN